MKLIIYTVTQHVTCNPQTRYLSKKQMMTNLVPKLYEVPVSLREDCTGMLWYRELSKMAQVAGPSNHVQSCLHH